MVTFGKQIHTLFNLGAIGETRIASCSIISPAVERRRKRRLRHWSSDTGRWCCASVARCWPTAIWLKMRFR